ncbi:hypothetical protein T4C_3848, partial [Trichinella pseudospiralis]
LLVSKRQTHVLHAKRCNSTMRQFLHDFDASLVAAVVSSTTFSWKSANWLQFSETAARTMQSSHFSFFKLLCIDNIYCKIERSYYACTGNELNQVLGLLFHLFTVGIKERKQKRIIAYSPGDLPSGSFITDKHLPTDGSCKITELPFKSIIFQFLHTTRPSTSPFCRRIKLARR